LIFKFQDPSIIDLVGVTGARKTTLCQQFVDEEIKKTLLKEEIFLMDVL